MVVTGVTLFLAAPGAAALDLGSALELTPTTLLPPITVPAVSLPDATLPPVNVTLPPSTVPAVSLPGASVPPITVPPVTVPPVTIPPVTVPAIALPGVVLPPITVPPTSVLGSNPPPLASAVPAPRELGAHAGRLAGMGAARGGLSFPAGAGRANPAPAAGSPGATDTSGLALARPDAGQADGPLPTRLRQAAAETAQRLSFPMGLALAIAAFLFLQHRMSGADPRVASEGVIRDDDLLGFS